MRISDWSSDVCSSDLDDMAQFIALVVDRGDDRPHRDTEFDEHRFGQLERAFDGFGNGVGGAGAIEFGGVGGIARACDDRQMRHRSEEHTSELQSLMRNSYAVFCLKKKKNENNHTRTIRQITSIKHENTRNNTQQEITQTPDRRDIYLTARLQLKEP